MKFKVTGKYSAASECSRYCITWGELSPPYFAHIAGQRGTYGGSLGRHETRDEAKQACITHAKGTA